jgi:hypothetical protein
VSLTNIITIVGVVLSVSAVLYIGYQQRRQMRQIELNRIDPKVGLVPPPNPVWKFIISNLLLLCTILPAVALILDVISSEPLTRKVVASIAFDVGSILFLFVMYVNAS